MRIIVSWYAYNTDFADGAVSAQSPTLQFHTHFFAHDKHLLLSSEKSDDTRLELLANRLATDFPDRKHKIETRYLPVADKISLVEIKPKVEALLLEHASHEIDIFFSPGTSAMQLAWYICHTTLGLRTRLLQTRPPRYNKGDPELIEIREERSAVPVTAVLREQLHGKGALPETHKITASLQPVYDRAGKLAQTDAVTCLISGASGTGKENLARYIHEQSARRTHPFVPVNCSALSDGLLESRLFGHKKGSFTGAEKDAAGLFEAAHGGTLFLDEIGDISPYMQQALLRVLQEREITPVGDAKPRPVNVRIIAATHRDLRERCGQERFRWDLFYRLSVAELHLPTLAERGAAEKQEMIAHFLKTKRKSLRKDAPLTFTPDAEAALAHYLFPGNVRELENLIESLYVFHDGPVAAADLPARITAAAGADGTFSWPHHEKALIGRALAFFGGNKRRACQALGYGSVNTLEKKRKAYGL